MIVICNEEDEYVVKLDCTEEEYNVAEMKEFGGKLTPFLGRLYFSEVDPAGRRVVKMALVAWFDYWRPYVAYYNGQGCWPGASQVA